MTDHRKLNTVSLLQEELDLTKIEVVTDRLQIRTTVEQRDIVIQDELIRSNLTVERVSVDLPVVVAPEPRQEGNTLIVSVIEERLVVEKRLFVVEEVRITRTSSSVPISIPQTVRVMHAAVERKPTSSTTGNENDG